MEYQGYPSEKTEKQTVMQEVLANPCVGAIIEKYIDGEKYILLQTRFKADGGDTNGKLELPAGKIREYESIMTALRREVYEETGLTVTKVMGSDSEFATCIGKVETVSVKPFCVTQNLSGAYSIILLTFICEAEGDLLDSTDETQNIRWAKADCVRQSVIDEPEQFFFMHINALKKYFNI